MWSHCVALQQKLSCATFTFVCVLQKMRVGQDLFTHYQQYMFWKIHGFSGEWPFVALLQTPNCSVTAMKNRSCMCMWLVNLNWPVVQYTSCWLVAWLLQSWLLLPVTVATVTAAMCFQSYCLQFLEHFLPAILFWHAFKKHRSIAWRSKEHQPKKLFLESQVFGGHKLQHCILLTHGEAFALTHHTYSLCCNLCKQWNLCLRNKKLLVKGKGLLPVVLPIPQWNIQL